MNQVPDLVARLVNAFDPALPLELGDPFYVDCHAVRGDDDILRELGKKIERSDKPTCQIYTGHRGVGKTTELLRLKKKLEGQGYRVVYFAADNDIDEEDAQYTDILLAYTRHILENLQDQANPKPLVNWLQSRWNSLLALALTEVKFEDLKIEQQISQFAKLTATLRQVPSTRQQIRDQVEIHSISLLDALNEFIADAIRKLGNSKLVVIADNLDRIVPTPRDQGGTNHDEIFINRSGQLQGLKCHVIYTVPISLVYSNRATALRDNYGDCHVLPMLMVRRKDGVINLKGLTKVKELIGQRIKKIDSQLALETGMFENAETLEQLCLNSGGHMREVIQLTESALNRIDTLSLSAYVVRQTVSRARSNYHNAVDQADWPRLAEVLRDKKVPNDGDYRNLLFSRCVLEYRYLDENGELVTWHDVHPLLKGAPELRRHLEESD